MTKKPKHPPLPKYAIGDIVGGKNSDTGNFAIGRVILIEYSLELRDWGYVLDNPANGLTFVIEEKDIVKEYVKN